MRFPFLVIVDGSRNYPQKLSTYLKKKATLNAAGIGGI
jgi:hypothetical protein